MIRTSQDSRTGFVTQPAHAAVSGWLAAHWGTCEPGAKAFAAPGAFAPSEQTLAIRAETIFAITEHDNGWWETDADPQPSAYDGLPRNFTDISADHPDEGLERWRRGVARFAARRPYAALLISMHAYHLVAADLRDDLDARLHYPGLGKSDLSPPEAPPPVLPPVATLERFINEQVRIQEALAERVAEDERLRSAVEHDHLQAHVRLLQICDWLSLAICLGRGDGWQAHDVPRRDLDDGVMLTLSSTAPRKLLVDPFPFDIDPLVGAVPMRWISPSAGGDQDGIARWHAAGVEWMPVELRSKRH